MEFTPVLAHISYRLPTPFRLEEGDQISVKRVKGTIAGKKIYTPEKILIVCSHPDIFDSLVLIDLTEG